MVFAVNYKAVARYFVRHERVALYSSVALLVCAICVAAVAYVSRPRVVEFGRYHGNSVQWEVLSEDSETMTLVSKSCVAAMSFEQGNGTNAAQNVWSSSTLRSWLNSVFLEEFSTQERERLIAMRTNAFCRVRWPHRATAAATQSFGQRTRRPRMGTARMPIIRRAWIWCGL